MAAAACYALNLRQPLLYQPQPFSIPPVSAPRLYPPFLKALPLSCHAFYFASTRPRLPSSAAPHAPSLAAGDCYQLNLPLLLSLRRHLLLLVLCS